jgi:hypothetical protein
MKRATLFSVPATNSNGYAWKWRSADGDTSKETFVLYHDCLADARKNGYDAQITTQGQSDPGASPQT